MCLSICLATLYIYFILPYYRKPYGIPRDNIYYYPVVSVGNTGSIIFGHNQRSYIHNPTLTNISTIKVIFINNYLSVHVLIKPKSSASQIV